MVISSSSAAWKHDIGNWQSRKSHVFQVPQPQAQRLHESDGAPPGGSLRHQGAVAGLFSSRQQRKSSTLVTFGPDLVLPSSVTPPPAQDVTDISLSALSAVSTSPNDRHPPQDATRPFDDDSHLAQPSSLITTDDAAVEESLWVTVFGVLPERFLDVRDALDVKCGPTATHHWPALGHNCNWMYVKFCHAFDAAKAVSMSPIELHVASCSGQRCAAVVLTIGVQWCRDATFVRERCVRAAESYQRVNSTVDSSGAHPTPRRHTRRATDVITADTLSFLSAASNVAEGRSGLTRPTVMLTLRAPQRGCITVIDALIGQVPLLHRLSNVLNRKDSPEHRLERLTTRSNQQHLARVAAQMLTDALGQNGPSPSNRSSRQESSKRHTTRQAVSHSLGNTQPTSASEIPLLAVWSTSPWLLWSTWSTLLSLAAVVLWLIYNA